MMINKRKQRESLGTGGSINGLFKVDRVYEQGKFVQSSESDEKMKDISKRKIVSKKISHILCGSLSGQTQFMVTVLIIWEN